MKEVVRLSTFETNSSSTHSFAFRTKTDKDYEKCTKCVRKMKNSFDKLIVVIGAAEMLADDVKSSLIMWVEENSDCIADAGGFVDKLIALNDKAKIADFLRNSNEITAIDAYDDYKDFVNDKIDVYDVFAEGYLISDYFRYMRYIDVAIKTYADSLELKEEDVKEKIATIKIHSSDYICRELFEEGPLSDCYCGIDSIFDNIENEQDVEKLMCDLLSDELSIFCYESFGSATIDFILDNPDDYE